MVVLRFVHNFHDNEMAEPKSTSERRKLHPCLADCPVIIVPQPQGDRRVLLGPRSSYDFAAGSGDPNAVPKVVPDQGEQLQKTLRQTGCHIANCRKATYPIACIPWDASINAMEETVRAGSAAGCFLYDVRGVLSVFPAVGFIKRPIGLRCTHFV